MAEGAARPTHVGIGASRLTEKLVGASCGEAGSLLCGERRAQVRVLIKGASASARGGQQQNIAVPAGKGLQAGGERSA